MQTVTTRKGGRTKKSAQRIRLGFVFVVAVLAGFASSASMAANFSFLNRSVAAKFDAEDHRLQADTAMALLKQGAVGDSKDWENPKTSANGTISVMKIFVSSEGFACKSLRVRSSAAGRKGQATYSVCEIKPGEWKIHSAAKPAT